ncbi:hypothetical protein SETIT_9G035200v2 [Setaria italica]|uniref:F-box domain-containing protein n=1 Tax=Setaria italica TaxID=4555 RepID=A0A368SCY2_SETIT|nr:hypothetical protein SETIT_9G035200v2 [Setaria italica]
MESSDYVGEEKQANPMPATDHGDGVDLISALFPMMCSCASRLVGDAGQMVRTGALSRRWRCLRTRVPALHFHSGPGFQTSSYPAALARRFIAFVNNVLAMRARTDDSAMEYLGISLDLCSARGKPPLAPSSAGAAEGWYEFALARVRLPSAVVFTSLTDLALECLEIADDTGDLLGRLLSSACCPRLRKLRLWVVRFKHARTKELVLETSTLVELTMYDMDQMGSLELRTPNLLDLKIRSCRELEALTISVSGLMEPRITMLDQLPFSAKPPNEPGRARGDLSAGVAGTSESITSSSARVGVLRGRELRLQACPRRGECTIT